MYLIQVLRKAADAAVPKKHIKVATTPKPCNSCPGWNEGGKRRFPWFKLTHSMEIGRRLANREMGTGNTNFCHQRKQFPK
jgi:hypothetical protein